MIPVKITRSLRVARFAIIFACMPALALAEAAADDGRELRGDAAIEIVNQVPCFSRKTLRRVVAERMRFAAGDSPQRGKAKARTRLRLIVSAMPDAAGTVRSIGPSGTTYRPSPFWRHPVMVKLQVIENGGIVREFARQVLILCDARSAIFGQAVSELIAQLFGSSESFASKTYSSEGVATKLRS